MKAKDFEQRFDKGGEALVGPQVLAGVEKRCFLGVTARFESLGIWDFY